jgi:hypothetical protein
MLQGPCQDSSFWCLKEPDFTHFFLLKRTVKVACVALEQPNVMHCYKEEVIIASQLCSSHLILHFYD